jgi:hypothetical protein
MTAGKHSIEEFVPVAKPTVEVSFVMEMGTASFT